MVMGLLKFFVLLLCMCDLTAAQTRQACKGSGIRCPRGEMCDKKYCYKACDTTIRCQSGEKCVGNFCLKDCDMNSDKGECSADPLEICINGSCREAVGCDVGSGCGGTPGILCVSDYCQPDTCTATGQCVTGHVCSQDTIGTCVYPIDIIVKEDTHHELAFEEPATNGKYEEIQWMKGKKLGVNKISRLHSVVAKGIAQYYGEYCSSGDGPCNTSDKGHLDVDTGNFTIKKVELTDDDYYYYRFYAPNNTQQDTGNKYQYKLNVYVIGDLSMEGITNDPVEVGTKVSLTCTIDRIKPKAIEMYWMINGKRENGTLSSDDGDNDKVFSQIIKHEYQVAIEDEGQPIKCIVVPVYGETVEQEQIVNPGYGPSGKPDLQPNFVEQYEGERVTLTCNKPSEGGNPDCDKYIWTKEGGSPEVQKMIYTFFMNESSVGNYTCKCENQYNTSEESNVTEVILVPGTAPTDSQSGEAGATAAIIGGAVGGVVFIILIVAIIGIFILRRRKKPKAVPDDESRLAQNNGYAQPEEPTYAQPNRKLRPQRGLNDALPGPQYMNSKELQGENAYENTSMDNNNPPAAKQNGITPEVVYTEVNIGKNDGENGTKPNKRGKPGLKPKPKERSSIKKPKVHQSEDSTVYAEIQPVKKDEQQ